MTTLRNLIIALTICLGFLFLSANLPAQQITGNIRGTVVDQT
jgi:hypothetical protein